MRGIYTGDPNDHENRQKAWRGVAVIVGGLFLLSIGWQGWLAAFIIVMAWASWENHKAKKSRAAAEERWPHLAVDRQARKAAAVAAREALKADNRAFKPDRRWWKYI